VWTLLASLYIGNVLLLVLNLPLVRLWVLLLRIPAPWLYGGILVVATVGAWSVHRSSGDILALVVIGLVGLGLRRVACPLAPVMIGFMLGPAADMHLRRALAVGDGGWATLVTRPIAGALLAVCALLLAAPPLWRAWRRDGAARPGVQGTGLH
jgi:putative tricarboxylic transport membrane protein